MSMKNKQQYHVESNIGECPFDILCPCLAQISTPHNSVTFYDKNIVVTYQRSHLKFYKIAICFILLVVSIPLMATGDLFLIIGVVFLLLAIIGAIALACLGDTTETFVIPRNLITDLQYSQASMFRCTPVTSYLRIGTLYKWDGWLINPFCSLMFAPYLTFGLETRGIEVFLGDVRVDTKFLAEYLDQPVNSQELTSAFLGSHGPHDLSALESKLFPTAQFTPSANANAPTALNVDVKRSLYCKE